MKYIKKYWFIIVIIGLCIVRFLISYKLPSYILSNLTFDDLLVTRQLLSLIKGNYLGDYSVYTLVKGIIYPLILYYARLLKISYSALLTILYILSCIYFLTALRNIIKNKIWLLIKKV